MAETNHACDYCKEPIGFFEEYVCVDVTFEADGEPEEFIFCTDEHFEAWRKQQEEERG